MDEIDKTLWREAMSGFLTGVTIVTTHDDEGAPAGTAVNAFCALSMEPPLLLVCLDRGSRTLDMLRRAGSFCVNILSDRHEAIVGPFASKSEADRFGKVSHSHTVSGDPVLDDSVAWFDCAVHQILEGGDHEIVIGRVKRLGSDREAAPLAYHRGQVWPLFSDKARDASR